VFTARLSGDDLVRLPVAVTSTGRTDPFSTDRAIDAATSAARPTAASLIVLYSALVLAVAMTTIALLTLLAR
jgi:hypothetical protein